MFIRATQLFTRCRSSLHDRVSYRPKHLLLIRHLCRSACKPNDVTLSILSHYGLLRYCGKRARIKRIIHQSTATRLTSCARLAGNGAAVIIGNRPRSRCYRCCSDDHYNLRKRFHNLNFLQRHLLRATMDSSRECTGCDRLTSIIHS